MSADAKQELLEAAEHAVGRLEAWMDGEKSALLAAERRGDRHAAEGHYNMVTNYMRLANKLRAAISKTSAGSVGE